MGRRTAAAWLLAATFVCAAAAWPARASQGRATEDPAPRAEPPAPLAPERDGAWRAEAKERTNRSATLLLGEQAATGVFLAWFAFSGASARLRDRVAARLARTAARRAAFVAALLALLLGVSFPFDAARYALSRLYGISNQSPPAWLGDYAADFAASLVIGVGLCLAFYALLDRRPRTWWRWAGASAAPLAALAVLFSPLYQSLFNTFEPLGDRRLAGEILALASEHGVRAEDVYVVDLSRQSRAANAFVTGFGPTTRVALGDTLLENFSDEEVLFVTAHEVGHYVLGHLWLGVAASVAGAFAGAFLAQRACRLALIRFHERLRVDDVADVASLPLVLLVAGALAFAAQPAAMAFSRSLEAAADEFALEATVPGRVSPEAAVSVFERLGRLGLSDPSPNPVLRALLWTHPTLDEREEAVRAWARGGGAVRAPGGGPSS